MKNTIFRVIAWVTLILGILLIIMPVTPGIPLLIFSAYLFALIKQSHFE